MVEECRGAEVVNRVNEVDFIPISYTCETILDIDQALVVGYLRILGNLKPRPRLRHLLALIALARRNFLLHLVNESNGLRKCTHAILDKVLLASDGLFIDEAHLV